MIAAVPIRLLKSKLVSGLLSGLLSPLLSWVKPVAISPPTLLVLVNIQPIAPFSLAALAAAPAQLVLLAREAVAGVDMRLASMAVNDGKIDRILSVVLGYATILAVAVAYMGFQADYSRARELFKVAILFKIVVFVGVEIILFPTGCGLILNLVTVPLFKTTIAGRMSYYNSSPLASLFLTWLSGTLWMFTFSMVVDVFR